MSSQIPTEIDWGNWKDDIDQKFSHGIYFGHSNEEMQERFLSAPVEAAEELAFMPAIPFQYYIIGFRDSVLSLKQDPFVIADAASCFLRLILNKLINDRNIIIPIMDSLIDAVDFVAENQEKYDADIDIYGDFKELENQIKNKLIKTR